MSQQVYSSQPYLHKNNQHYVVEHNKQLKCICQLCQCGRHQCPRKPIRGDYQTTYTREYKKIDNVQPTGKPTTYRYQNRHYSQDVLKTSYQQDYDRKQLYQQQAPLSKSRLELLGQKLVSTQVPFNGTTSYKDQYQPYKIKNINDFNNPQTDILSPLKSMNYPLRPAVKFQGISSYNSSYLPPPQPKKSQAKYPISNYYRPPVPFSGSTSYNDHYKPFEVSSKKQQIYDSRLLLENAPQVKFQGSTSYNDHYPAYELDNSRMSMKSNCKLDQIRLPAFNYINDQEHIFYDEVNNKFV